MMEKLILINAANASNYQVVAYDYQCLAALFEELQPHCKGRMLHLSAAEEPPAVTCAELFRTRFSCAVWYEKILAITNPESTDLQKIEKLLVNSSGNRLANIFIASENIVVNFAEYWMTKLSGQPRTIEQTVYRNSALILNYDAEEFISLVVLYPFK